MQQYYMWESIFSSNPINISVAGNIWVDGPTLQGIVIYSVIIPIICVFGMVGNFVSFLVLGRKEFKGSIFVYLDVLAFTDCCSSILLFISGLSRGVLFSNNWPIFDALLILPLSEFFNTVAILITLMLTVDRVFITACISGRKKSYCRSTKARKMVVFFVIFAIVYNLPLCFIFNSDEQGVLTTEATYYSRFYSYYNWSKLFVFGVGPSVLLLLGNGYLIYTFRKFNRMPQSLDKSRRKYCNSMTAVLILIVFLFLLTEIPQMLISRPSVETFFCLNVETDCNTKSLEVARQLVTIINALSLPADFVLYYLYCPLFCKVLNLMWRRRRPAKSIQMTVFVLDNQMALDKKIASVEHQLTTSKILGMFSNEKQNSGPSSMDSSQQVEGAVRDTLISFCGGAV